MSISIPTEQGFVMTYHYGQKDLQRLKKLIIGGGEKVINGDYLQSENKLGSDEH